MQLPDAESACCTSGKADSTATCDSAKVESCACGLPASGLFESDTVAELVSSEPEASGSEVPALDGEEEEAS